MLFRSLIHSEHDERRHVVSRRWIVLLLLLTWREMKAVDADVVPGVFDRTKTVNEFYRKNESLLLNLASVTSCSLAGHSNLSAEPKSASGTYRYGGGYCCCSNKLLDVAAIVALALTAFYFLIITKIITVGRRRRSASLFIQHGGLNELKHGI